MIPERARAGFAEALDGHPWNSVDTLCDEIAAGHGLVWSGERADVYVRFSPPAIEIGPACGDMDEIVHVFRPLIETYAAQHGFSELHIQAGRSGWTRALKPFGYDEAAVILRKHIRGPIQ